MANIVNLGSTFVVTAPSPATSGTTLTVTSATAADLPAAPFYATATPQGSLSTKSTAEIVLVTDKTSDTLTIVRAQLGTTAKSIATGWVFTNSIYKEDLFSTITFGEVPTGATNGVNPVYTTAQPFTSIEVFKNGVRMKGGGADYTITNSTTITMVSPPATGAVMLVNYVMGNSVMVVGSNSFRTDETPSGLVNGTNPTFTTSQSYIGGSLEVFVNGIKQKRITHFTESSPGTGTFVLSDAPITGDDIMVNYMFVSATTGNADTVDGFNASATPTANTIPVLDVNAKLPSSTFFTGSNGIQSQANSGSAGGTMYYANIAGIKLLWGVTGIFTNDTSGASRSVIYPTGFFTGVQSATASIYNLASQSQQSANIIAPSNTQMSIITYSASTTAGENASYMVIGV